MSSVRSPGVGTFIRVKSSRLGLCKRRTPTVALVIGTSYATEDKVRVFRAMSLDGLTQWPCLSRNDFTVFKSQDQYHIRGSACGSESWDFLQVAHLHIALHLHANLKARLKSRPERINNKAFMRNFDYISKFEDMLWKRMLKVNTDTGRYISNMRRNRAGKGRVS